MIDVKGRFHLVVERELQAPTNVIDSLGTCIRGGDLHHSGVELVVGIWVLIVLEERNTESGGKIKQTGEGAGSDSELLGEICCLAVGEDISKSDSSLGSSVERFGGVSLSESFNRERGEE